MVKDPSPPTSGAGGLPAFDSRNVLGSVSGIVVHALISGLNSNNVMVNTSICVATPFLMRTIFNVADDVWPLVCSGTASLLYSSATKVLELADGAEGVGIEDRRNDLLFKAVLLYLSKLQAELPTPALTDGKIMFVAPDDTATDMRMHEYNEMSNGRGGGDGKSNQRHNYLQRFEISCIPHENAWVGIRGGLRYMLFSRSAQARLQVGGGGRGGRGRGGAFGDFGGGPGGSDDGGAQTVSVSSIKFQVRPTPPAPFFPS